MTLGRLFPMALVGAGLALAGLLAAQQAQTVPAGEAPRYEADGRLIPPANYREWPFLGAGLGMTYDEPAADGAAAPRRQNFTNVFVNPSSYRAFL